MAKKGVKTYRGFYKFVQLALGTYLKSSFNMQFTGLDEVKKLSAPYVVLGNHTNFWDPFMVACVLPEPVHFVTSDEYFRNPLLKTLLGLVGAIPKMKFVSDSDTVKEVIRVKNRKGVVGIFPEGARNWDGKTIEILYPTAKLVKTLKIPVVTALLQGAALSYPRWAKKSRRGKLVISYKVALTAEQVQILSVDEIYAVICRELDFDEYNWQEQAKIPFRGRRLAEHLELFLFTCPHCRQIGTLKSVDDQFFCRECGYSTHYTQFGYFEGADRQYFDNPRDWNQWQLGVLRELIAEAQRTGGATPILVDGQVSILRGSRFEPLEQLATGRLELYPDRLQFVGDGGTEISVPLEGINGLNIQYNDRFEFYYDKSLYRFTFADEQYISAYKWVQAMGMLQAKGEGKVKVTQ